jgi:carboxymethylenebutenolidase
MAERTVPYSLTQVGTGTVRFPSGAPIPSISDAAVDPYHETRISKHYQVEGLLFWPQEKRQFPGIVLLHDHWGLNVQIKNLGNRLACEGFAVLLPNLYGRQGGMVTANGEVAEALGARLKDAEMMQDINSCCEYLNSRDHVTRQAHAVVGFGLGASLAMRFATRRKRLRGAVCYHGAIPDPIDELKELMCPLLYHRAGSDARVSDADIARLERAAKEFDKRIDIRTHPEAPAGFTDDMRADRYRPDAAAAAWDATVAFLTRCFETPR